MSGLFELSPWFTTPTTPEGGGALPLTLPSATVGSITPTTLPLVLMGVPSGWWVGGQVCVLVQHGGVLRCERRNAGGNATAIGFCSESDARELGRDVPGRE